MKKAKTKKIKKEVNDPIDTWRYHWVDSLLGKKDKKINKIAIEDLIIVAVLTFCENAAELGCPRDKDVDMWFRELSYKDAYKVAEKMLEIEERNIKLYHDKKE